MSRKEKKVMYRSKLNPKFTFNEEIWVLSEVDSGQSTNILPVDLGHTILVVEGIERDLESMFTQLFVAQYDIRARVNHTSDTFTTMVGKEVFVSEVRIFEGNKYMKDYTNMQSQQHYANAMLVKKMIKEIKEDHQRVVDAEFGVKGANPLKFKILPRQNDVEVNCCKWVKQKLLVAGIDSNLSKKTNKPKVAVSTCVLY